jgi:hypothetical protein
MTSTACDDQFSPETEPRPTVAVCARTHPSDQVFTGNYLQIDAERLEEECRLARERGKVVCVWTWDNYEKGSLTGCGFWYSQNNSRSGPFTFCPNCGKPIKVKT